MFTEVGVCHIRLHLQLHAVLFGRVAIVLLFSGFYTAHRLVCNTDQTAKLKTVCNEYINMLIFTC